MSVRNGVGILMLTALALAACAPAQEQQLNTALETISSDELADHIQVLSADEFQGRLPGTVGEEKTIEYLRGQFSALGLEPGNGDSWYQEVPLVSIEASPGMSLAIRRDGQASSYEYGEEFMAWTKRVVDSVELENSDMIFVGYGVVAPEYDWNDYEGLDVEGKTVVMLVNDPGYATEDPDLFNGRAMTYYGRWTYKYEEAARQGAASALIVHETGPAGYGWGVVSGGWSGPQFDLVREDNNMSRVKVEGWLHLDAAREVFSNAGLDYDQLKSQAASRDFEPVPMGTTASVIISNTIDRSTSNNVLALLPGSERPDEYIIYMGHWDHLGRDTTLEGDQIYNGAFDNASGIASILELADAFTALPQPPERSIVFFATAAEEQGLLGSEHYANNPVYPLDQTVAAINIDGLNIYGPMEDIVVVGYGSSELDQYLAAAAAEQDRTLVPDPEAEKGFFYRSDHFPLAKQGVPALYTDPGTTHVEHGTDFVTQKKAEYIEKHYHSPSDEYSSDWDLSGGVQDTRLFFRVGYQLANETTFPNWTEGTEFKAKRDAMMATAR